MDWTLLTFLACIVTIPRAISSEQIATINMKGFKAVLRFKQLSDSVIVTIAGGTNIPTGAVQVEIMSLWVRYDVKEKCSNTMLGDQVAKPIGPWYPASQTTITLEKTDLADIQGRSIRIQAAGTYYCASILDDDGEQKTAMANFAGIVAGPVYFRQKHNENTLVASNLVADINIFQNLKWKIVKNIKGCDDIHDFTGEDVYSDLSKELGPLKSGLTTYNNSGVNNLRMTDIKNNFLIISEDDDVACSKIQIFQPRKATALFSHLGIHGDISFSQSSPFNPSETSVNLGGLNLGAKGYHVHMYPVPIQEENGQSLCSGEVVAGHFNPFNVGGAFPAAGIGTDDQYEIGDLSSKYGTLENLKELKRNYTDWNLPLFGKYSIVGRSIVIHKADSSNSRWVCSTIHLVGSVVSGVAVFRYPVYGQVYFTQAADSPNTDTWIFSHLSILEDNDKPAPTDYKWFISMTKAGDDFMEEIEIRCAGNKDVLNPHGQGKACTMNDPATKCKLGDLSGKLGHVSIATYPQTKSFFTDVYLPMSGDEALNIIGKSVTLVSTAGHGEDITACATIQPVHKPTMKAQLSLGTVTFSQEPCFGQRPTTVSLDLPKFDSGKHKLQIYALPPVDGISGCDHLGEVYNPLKISVGQTSTTHDQFKVGDLTRGESSHWLDMNLPLTGSNSVRHRTLVVLDSQSKAVTCGIIQFPYSKATDGYKVVARATFSDPLSGYIDFIQTLSRDNTTTDTSVVVNLSNEDGSKTSDHNWHVHEKSVSGDAAATSGRCAIAGPHYDPYLARQGKATTHYGDMCSKINPLRCELGDQAMKLGTYSMGSGRQLFTDVDLPLNGKYKVQGRSIVVHVGDRGAERYACADINPVSILVLAMKFKTPDVMDLQLAAGLYAVAIQADQEEIVLEYISTSDDVTKVHVHFLGYRREVQLSTFLAYFDNESNRKHFGDYSPITAPAIVETGESKAGGVVFSSVLLLVTLTISTIVFHV